jgi:hypothetical protein
MVQYITNVTIHIYLKNINLLQVQNAQNNYIYFKLKLKMKLHFLTLKTGNKPVSPLLGNYGTSSVTMYNPAPCTMDTISLSKGYSGYGMGLTTHLPLASRLKKE